MTLLEYIKSKKITHTEFAQVIGITPQAIDNYVGGKRLPKQDIMLRIIRATNGLVTPNDFFEHTRTPKKGAR